MHTIKIANSARGYYQVLAASSNDDGLQEGIDKRASLALHGRARCFSAARTRSEADRSRLGADR